MFTETQKMYIFMYICGSKAICVNYQKLMIFAFTQAFLKCPITPAAVQHACVFSRLLDADDFDRLSF